MTSERTHGELIRMDAIQPPASDGMWCGVDVVSIERIAGLLDEFGDSFRERVYTSEEQRYCEAQPDPPQHYAARWAAKEAFVKTVDADAPSIPLHAIGVRHDGDDPVLVLSAPATAAAVATVGAEAAERIGTAVSLSHDRYADCAAGQVLVFDRGRIGSGDEDGGDRA
jgi:holo-[acyl-carrier protein] synthase